jgi:hypothetical protein
VCFHLKNTKSKKDQVSEIENQVDDYIVTINKIYNKKYNKFLFYCWVTKHIAIPQAITNVRRIWF